MAEHYMRVALLSMWRKGVDISPETFAAFFFQWSDRYWSISVEEAEAFLSKQNDFVF
jgi:hypothetical protein